LLENHQRAPNVFLKIIRHKRKTVKKHVVKKNNKI
jgi:hypothetical protein